MFRPVVAEILSFSGRVPREHAIIIEADNSSLLLQRDRGALSPKSLISQQPLVETSGSFRQITLEFNLYNDRSVSFKVSHDFPLVPFILPLTRIVPLIKKTYGQPVPIDFLSFYIQTPCDILFSTKLLIAASIEKKRKTIRTGVGSRFLNCWTPYQENQ